MQRKGFQNSGPVSEYMVQTNWLNQTKAGSVVDQIEWGCCSGQSFPVWMRSKCCKVNAFSSTASAAQLVVLKEGLAERIPSVACSLCCKTGLCTPCLSLRMLLQDPCKTEFLLCKSLQARSCLNLGLILIFNENTWLKLRNVLFLALQLTSLTPCFTSKLGFHWLKKKRGNYQIL